MNRKVGILVAIYAAVLAINLDTTIVNVALPTMARDLDAGTTSLQWVVDGYTLAFATLVLAAGSMSDRYGRRPALIVGLLGFAAASVAGAMATSVGALVAARIVMGVFAALIFPTTLSVISNAFPDRKERAAALGGWGAVVGVGVAAGPVTGGLLLTHFAWGSVFLALAPLAVLAAVLAAYLVPESRDPRVPPLDVAGLVLSVAVLSLLTYTIIEAPTRGWDSAWTLGGFMLTAALLAVFVRVERRAAHPLLDVTLFADRRFSAASGAVTITFFSLAGFIFLITQYFQLIRGYDPLSTGARILPVAVAIAVASVAGGVLAPRWGTRSVVTTGLLLFGVAMTWIGVSAVDVSYATVIVPQMVLMGLGMGLVSTPATESILLVLPPSRAGVGSAVNDATRELGATLGVAVVGSLFSSVFSSRLGGSAFAQLPQSGLAQAQESVTTAISLGQNRPDLLDAARESFMSALHAGTLLVAAVCLLGAAVAAIALPGRGFTPPVVPEPTLEPAETG
ncbi:MAG: MFS transporter [Lapillicoccus sp.]